MSISSADYAGAFGSNKVGAAGGDDEDIAHAADYREPRQMTRMEDCPTPMEQFLQKTKLRHIFGPEANCCSRVYWIIVLLLLAVLTVTGTWGMIAGFVYQGPKVSWADKPITEIRFPVVHFHNFNQIRKSFLTTVNITAGAAEHKAFVSEYYRGNGGDINQTDLVNVVNKLTSAELLDNFSFYAAAAQECDKMVIDGPELIQSIGEKSIGCSSDMEKSKPEEFGEYTEKEKDKEDRDWDKAKKKYKKMIRKARYMVDVAAYDYDFSSSLADGAVGFTLVLSQQPEKRPVITPEALSISPGTITNLDVEPFFVEDWWSAWAKGDFAACKWNDTDDYDDYDWDMRYDKNDKTYSRDRCRYDSMAKKVGEECKCSPRFNISADSANGTCRGAGIACAEKMGSAVEYKDCAKPCYDVTNEHSVAYSGKWPSSIHSFLESRDFCSVVKRISEVCDNGSDTKAAVDEAYPELCQDFQVANASGGLCNLNEDSGMAAAKNFSTSAFKYASDNIAIVNVIMARERAVGVYIHNSMDYATMIGGTAVILLMYFGVTMANIFEGFLLLVQGIFGCGK